jgi:hypothetical protein
MTNEQYRKDFEAKHQQFCLDRFEHIDRYISLLTQDSFENWLSHAKYDARVSYYSELCNSL